jgi:hypothetical protein
MTGNSENKRNSSSFSVYIKLRQMCNDKMQLLTICFDNIPSSTLRIYRTYKHQLRHLNYSDCFQMVHATLDIIKYNINY